MKLFKRNNFLKTVIHLLMSPKLWLWTKYMIILYLKELKVIRKTIIKKSLLNILILIDRHLFCYQIYLMISV